MKRIEPKIMMMKIKGNFRLAILLVLVIMVFVAIVPYQTNRSTHESMVSLRKSLNKEQHYEDLLTLLRDAETGQRGFIITGKENFLKPYYSAIGELPSLRKTMSEENSGSPEDQQALQKIFAVSDQKMAELSETIAIRRAKGFHEVEPIVSSERGKQYMDTLRELIGKQLERSIHQRNAVRTEMERKADMAFYVGMGATLANLALLVFLMLAIFRSLKEHRSTAELLQGTSEQLSKSVAEIELRNDQMELSAEMLQALGSISSLEETSSIIATYCSKLLHGLSGTLFLYRNSRDLLEVQVSWGNPGTPTDHMEPKACWALQRGHAHYTNNANDLRCSHYAGAADRPLGRLCVPLVTQGEVIGLIYLEGLSEQQDTLKSQQHLVDRVAEQIALALSNVKLRETLRLQSIIDPLTGLYNRRYMDETLKRELYRAERKKTSLALIILDLDHFKRINDTFGHDAGDALLKCVAQQVQENIRESDLACRFGGEELVLILSECDIHSAEERAEKIRIAIAALNVHHGGRTLGTATASFGVAVFPDNGRDANVLIHAADQALYRAKQTGRNCIVKAAAY
jgi:diguanylate cyclase (GGDEF)-like protein